jgi:hypothetical protein
VRRPMSTGKACLVVLAPIFFLWVLALMWEQTPGAYAQATTTKTSNPAPGETSTRAPTTTVGPPSTTFMPPTRTDPPPTTDDTVGPTSTTYMIPGVTSVPNGGGSTPTNATPDDCHTPPGVTEVTWKCNGATWICHDKVATPGTYCIDP